MPSLPASPTSTASAEDHSDSRDTHKSSSSPATTKKKRLRRKALSEEEDIAILKAVAQIQPHKAKHGRGRRVWDETAAVYKELTGDEMTPVLVRGRYENLIKRYNMVLEGRGKREWIMSDEFKKLMEDAYADRAILVKTDKSEPESAASGQGVGEATASSETVAMEDTDAPPLKRGRGPTIRAHVRAVKSALGKRSEPASPPISNVGPRQTKPRTVDMPLTTANTPTKDAVTVAAPTQQPKVEPTQTVQDQRTDTAAATATPPTTRPTIPAPTPLSATAPTPPAAASAPTPAPAPAPVLRGTTVTRSAGHNSPAQTTSGATPSILTRPSQLVVQREFTPPPKPAVLDRQRNTNKQPLQALSRSHSLTTPNQQPGVPNEVLRQQSLEVQRNALFGAAMTVMASGASSKAPSPPPLSAQPSNVPPATAQPSATPMSVAYLSVVNSTASSSTPTVDSSKQTPSSTATSSATVTAAPGKNPVAPSVAPPTRNTSQSNGTHAVPAPVPAATVPKSSATPASIERPTYYPPRYLLPSVQNGARHPMPGGVMVPHRTRSEVPMDLEVPKSPAAPQPAQKNKPESSNTASRPLTAAAAAEALTEESADVGMLDDHRSFVKSTIVAVCDRLKEMEKMWIQEADRRRTTQDQAAQNTLRAHLSSARSSSSQQGTTTPNAQQSPVDIGKDVNTALVAEVVSLREALSRGAKERQELENELASVAALAREADDERTQLRQQVTQLSEQVQSQQRQYQTLHSDFTSLATQLKDLGSVAKMIKDMETAHGNLQRSLQTHEKDVSYQQVDIKKFQHEVRVELDALGSTVRENADKQTQLASQIADTQHDMESQFKLVSRALDEERKQREIQHTELLSGIRDIVAADEL